VRSATLNVPQAHAGANQAEEDAVLASAGAPGNVTGAVWISKIIVREGVFLTLLL